MVSKSFTLPLFPLSFIMLPGERKPLRIFERRYKNLIYDINMGANATFGIPYVYQGKITNFGSIVHVNRIYSPDQRGEFDIIVECINLLKIDEYYSTFGEKPYEGGKVHHLELENGIKSQKLLDLFSRYQYEIISDDETDGMEGFGNIIDLARQLPLSMEEKYVFLKTQNPMQRERLLIAKLHLLFHIKQREDDLGAGFVYN